MRRHHLRALFCAFSTVLFTWCASCQLSGATETEKSQAEDWGPLVGPWKRPEKPIFTGRQCGGDLVHFDGKWNMLLFGGLGEQSTALAQSDDGKRWRIGREGILRANAAWEGSYNLSRTMLVNEGQVWIYYFGKQGIHERIGLARSDDMKHFTKDPANPIFRAEDSSLEGERVFPSGVVHADKKWFLFYGIGFDYNHPKHPRGYRICLAESANGVKFSDVDKNPIIDHGPKGSWDDKHVCQATVRKIGPWWYMMYVDATTRQEGKIGQAFGVARAKSLDGPWERYPRNPVFVPSGGANSWDGQWLQHPCPVHIEDQWYLYYTGNGGTGYSVGCAVQDAMSDDSK